MIKETIDLVKEYEGKRLKAYPDPGSKDGNPITIGYGHTGALSSPKPYIGMTITDAQAEQYLLNDLRAVEVIINKLVKVKLNDFQMGALTSFVFNIGETLFKKSSVLSYINKGKLSEVPGRMALYRINDGKVMDGLVRRRTAEGALWMKSNKVSTTVTTKVQAAKTHKPWNLGWAGMGLTMAAGYSDDAKKLIGNLTETFGINPLWILAVVGVGFAIWALYSRFKER